MGFEDIDETPNAGSGEEGAKPDLNSGIGEERAEPDFNSGISGEILEPDLNSGISGEILEPGFNSAIGEEKSEKPKKKERLTHREKRKRWKEAKRRKREELKEYYRYAPFRIRVWNLYLKRPFYGLLWIFVILCILVSVDWVDLLVKGFKFYYDMVIDTPLTEEEEQKIYELSPIDEEGQKRIDAVPAVDSGDTWTFCVYMVGSDLEDMEENDLSYVVDSLTSEKRKKDAEKKEQRSLERLKCFTDELAANGLELPAFFYNPHYPVASSDVVTRDVVVAEDPGAASLDIAEMTVDDWPENVSIVIQTGGARRWSNSMINPNRTQRFLVRNGDCEEVDNMPIRPAAEPETLAGFLRFCRNRYHSDHNVLILWNHGGGPFGFGYDSIYEGMLSLKDIHTALSSVYTPNPEDTAFDIIGFDACLMSTLEATHALDGFADYYCLSEETVPGKGWDYASVLSAMKEDPTMSPAKVAQHIVDSYMNQYMRETVKIPLLDYSLTFAVLDATKTAKIYEDYCALCEKQLLDSLDDQGVLADIGRYGSKATRFAGSYYNVYNMVDMGNYMDVLIDIYPEESSRIRDDIRDAVIYHRESGGLSDSTGLAVYLPTEVRDLDGLNCYLRYIYDDIAENDAVRALYYYKQAGCLNDDLKEYLSTITSKRAKPINIEVFRQFSKADPVFIENGFMIPIDERLQNLMVDRELEIGLYDEEEETLKYLGREICVEPDGEGNLVCDFDGKWICMDGQPLAVEVVSTTANSVIYRAHVFYNYDDAYLELTRNVDTDELSVTGVRKISEDDVNYLTNVRMSETPEPGATITPLYSQDSFIDNFRSDVEGDPIIFGKNTRLEMGSLPDGYYLAAEVISDPRGDSYYSAVVANTIKKGKLGTWLVDENFFGVER